MMNNLLEINDLCTVFQTEKGAARAVDGISIRIKIGATVALVGESGCGKSVSALSILDLVAKPSGNIAGGSMKFEGNEIPRGNDSLMQNFRGNAISMIFQEPMTSLNPVMKIGKQITEAIKIHQGNDENGKWKTRERLNREAIESLKKVGLPDAEKFFDYYPHNLSGGMRQRVMIAMAISCRPKLLIADEPTTALDVTVQAQIMELLKKIQKEEGMSILLITHDLALVEEQADYVYIMYAGKIVEEGPIDSVISNPHHPYTSGLLLSRPGINIRPDRINEKELTSIPGQVPEATEYVEHCRFAERCSRAKEICTENAPVLKELDTNRRSACFFPLN